MLINTTCNDQFYEKCCSPLKNKCYCQFPHVTCFIFIRGNDLRTLNGNVTIVYGVTVDERRSKCSKQKILGAILY